ncbi:11726_t:CDS:2, partial [Cetraspora pellucida]
PKKFSELITRSNFLLEGFFNEIFNAISPKNRNYQTRENDKKIAVGFCYLLARARNKFANELKIEIGLYLLASGCSSSAIDILSNLGISACYKTIDDYKKKVTKEHLTKISTYFTFNVTIFNNILFFNPLNIDANLINKYLLEKYNSIFDISYNTQKFQWNNQNIQKFQHFDRIELLTIHIYDDAICERKDERSIENVQIIDIEEYNLKSTADYIKALSMITKILSLYKYLDQNILPVIADWPGQLYIRKAITQLQKELNIQKNNSNYQITIPTNIKNFIPILGPLH